MKKSESIFGEFHILRKRPGMICYGRDLKMLIGYICGRQSNIVYTKGRLDLELYHSFQEYITQIYEENYGKGVSFYNLLILESNDDSQKAFDLFFELFDEFIEKNNIVFEWEGDITEVKIIL